MHLVATNKPDKVKQLKAKNRRLNKKKASARAIKNNVVDARFKLLQKALAKQTDARQNLTKPTDARNIIQERRLRSLSYDVSNQFLFFNVIKYSFKAQKLMMVLVIIFM